MKNKRACVVRNVILVSHDRRVHTSTCTESDMANSKTHTALWRWGAWTRSRTRSWPRTRTGTGVFYTIPRAVTVRGNPFSDTQSFLCFVGERHVGCLVGFFAFFFSKDFTHLLIDFWLFFFSCFFSILKKRTSKKNKRAKRSSKGVCRCTEICLLIITSLVSPCFVWFLLRRTFIQSWDAHLWCMLLNGGLLQHWTSLSTNQPIGTFSLKRHKG